MSALPYLGVGVSYRSRWRRELFAQSRPVGCLEIMAEDFVDCPPERDQELDQLLGRFPVLPHGLGASFGTDEPFDEAHAARIAQLMERARAPWFSEHLAFTHAGGAQLGHLAALPFTREAIAVTARNVRSWQRAVAAPLLLENITYTVNVPGEMTEAQFLTEVLDRTGCGLLLDLHNAHSNARNHGYDAREFIDSLPLERVRQIHLGGGHDEPDGYRIDAHDAAPPQEVWDLLRFVAPRAPIRAVILEWDVKLPPFVVIVGEVAKAEAIMSYGSVGQGAEHGAGRPASGAGAAVHG